MSRSPERPGIALSGHTAIVTGGGGGIGRAIAQALASAGAGVAVLARSAPALAETVALIERLHGRAEAFPLDVTDATRVEATLEAIERSLGPVSVLVNNAATLGPLGPFWDTAVADWWRAMDVNVRGPLLWTHAVLRRMIARRAGRIINVVSGTTPMTYFSSYITSKTALIRFTECLALETKPFGIAAFAMLPGTVRTPMAEYALESPEGRKWLPWFRRIFDEGLALEPERPAELAVLLASGKADPLSGHVVHASDDVDAMLARLEEIERDKLYSLRVRPLAGTANPLAAIRAVAEGAAEARVHLERSFAASGEQVFRAWTDPAAVAQWFLPLTDAHWIAPPRLDPRVGGAFGLELVSQGKTYSIRGTYLEVSPPDRLVFTWQWGDDIPDFGGPGDTEVRVSLVNRGRMTVCVITHTGFPSQGARDAHERGWSRCLDGMARLLA